MTNSEVPLDAYNTQQPGTAEQNCVYHWTPICAVINWKRNIVFIIESKPNKTLNVCVTVDTFKILVKQKYIYVHSDVPRALLDKVMSHNQ